MSKKRRKTSGKIRKPRNARIIGEIVRALNDGNYDKAIISLNTSQIQKLIPEARREAALAEAYFRRALRYRERYPADALRDLKQAVGINPEDPLYAYHLGLVHHEQGDFPEAIEWYRKVYTLDPRFKRAALPLLLAMRANGAPMTALEAEDAWGTLNDEQRTLLTGSFNDAEHGLPAALVAMQADNIEDAQRRFAEIIKNKRISDGHKAIAHDYLGRIAARHDEKHEALTHWRKAYDLGRRDPVFVENMALLYVLELEVQITEGNYKEAHTLVEQVDTYDLEHPRLAEIKAHVMLKLGYDAALAGDWQRALGYWATVDTGGITARAAAANLGLAYEEIEAYGRAADAWRDFVKRRGRKPGSADYLTPEQVGRLWSRISNLYMQNGQLDEAVNTLQTALKHDPDNIEMNLQLARRLAEADRTEAAHNQVDQVLEMAPNHVEALVLRAELWEVAPRQGFYSWGRVFGIEQWKDVLNAGDESYASLARQQLQNLYFEKIAYQTQFFTTQAQETAEAALREFPDFHIIRVMYIRILYRLNTEREVIWEQIDQVDLTDEQALHRLIDTVHTYDAHDDAETILKRAEAQKTLSEDFYTGVAHCAIDREQFDIANHYYQQALERTTDDLSYNAVQVDHAWQYYNQKMYPEAIEILEKVLEKAPRFGPAHLGMAAAIYSNESNKVKAKRHLRKARSWAKQHNDRMLLEEIEDLMFFIENPMPPLGASLGGLDPSMMPPQVRRMMAELSPEEIAELFGKMIDNFDEEDFY
jgi:tetratricopeptide (TPR) repeat protein